MNWQELATRCEQAEGPDRELDAEIEALFTDERGTRPLAFFQHEIANGYRRPCRFTGSIDAALTIVPEGYQLAIYTNWVLTAGYPENEDGSITITSDMPKGCWVRVYGDPYSANSIEGMARTPALALCAAALRASQQGGE